MAVAETEEGVVLEPTCRRPAPRRLCRPPGRDRPRPTPGQAGHCRGGSGRCRRGGLRHVPAVRLVRRGHPDLPRRDDAERRFDDRRRRRPHARVVMLAGAIGAILGDSSLFWIARMNTKMQPHLDKALENPKVRTAWDEPRPLSRPPDRRRALRPRDALRRQRVDGARPHPLPPLPRLVGHQRHPLVGLHMRARLLGGDHARRLPLASLIISSLITSAALAAVFFINRPRMRKERRVPRRPM